MSPSAAKCLGRSSKWSAKSTGRIGTAGIWTWASAMSGRLPGWSAAYPSWSPPANPLLAPGGSVGAGGPAGDPDDLQHQDPVEGLISVLRIAPGQTDGQGCCSVGVGVALPAQLGPHPPQP